MAHRYKFLKMNNCIDVMRDDDDAIYKSLIQEVKGSGLVIQEPTYRRFVMPLKPDQRVKVTVYSPDYKHCFDATVTEARNENNLVLYTLDGIENVVKHESRSFVRIKTAIDVKYKILPRYISIDKVADEAFEKEAIGIDLSGGGMMLSSRVEIPVNTFIALKFEVMYKDKPLPISLVATIKRCVLASQKRPARYLIGVSFCNIDERVRDNLIAYIFDKMLENMRRNL